MKIVNVVSLLAVAGRFAVVHADVTTSNLYMETGTGENGACATDQGPECNAAIGDSVSSSDSFCCAPDGGNAVCNSATSTLSARCCPGRAPNSCGDNKCTNATVPADGSCPDGSTPTPNGNFVPASNDTACTNQGNTPCCSPVWNPSTPATSTSADATYASPPADEFTCSAGYVAVASTGDASKCTQAGFTGTTSLGQLSTPPLTASYTFPANSPTGKYTCYTVSVPKNSCLGSTVYQFDKKAVQCVDEGKTWEACVQQHTQFLCTDHPDCKQIFVDRFNAAAALCGYNCLSTNIDDYNGYCETHLAAAPSDPCFAAETTTACKLAGDVTAAEARRQCYDDSKGADAELVLMKDLAAGDVVLAADASGALSLERVIVNQHKANPLASALLELHHSAGVLALTPDHVLLVDGAFGPARDTTPGSTLKLADGTKVVVERVTKAHGAVINPLTTSGTIVAGGVVASSHPEWTFAWAGKAPFPLFYGLAAAFPTTTQAYYDAVLEPLFDALGANLRPSALGASALVAPLALADAAAALGLGLFAGAAPAALAALALGVVTLRTRKA